MIKKKTKLILGSTGAVLALGLGLTAYKFYQSMTPQEIAIDKNASIQSNYYQFVNKDWLLTTELSADKESVSAISEIQDEIDQSLKKDVDALLTQDQSKLTSDQKEFVELYQLATDFDKREKEGLDALKANLSRIENLSSYQDFTNQLESLVLDAYKLPFAIQVATNLTETEKKQISLVPSYIFLPDVTYYEDEATKEAVLSSYKAAAKEALTLIGYSDKEAEQVLEDAIAFDAKVAKHFPSGESISDMKNMFNLRDAKTVADYHHDLKLDQLVNNLLKQDIDTINVIAPDYFENLSQLINQDNFGQMKSWMLVSQVMTTATMASEDLRQAVGKYDMELTGVQELPDKETRASSETQAIFSETISSYYGQKHFDQETKDDVTKMVDNIIAVYKKRLEANDWLSAGTKAKALNKLEHLNYYIGYQEEVSDFTKSIDVNTDNSYFDNVLKISREKIVYDFEHFNDPVDQSSWDGTPSYMVNAFYDPLKNAIYLPAAILEAPFYDGNQSVAENYGGIGATIGHEITHAFDTNGALFDEKGNYGNWWTEANFKVFEEKTQAMVDLFDGIEIYGSEVNGRLTVSENIADAGGLAVAYEALRLEEPSAKLEEFFESHVAGWRSKSYEQYMQMLMATDPHAPDELRANIQLKNFDAFYDVYDIKEGDAMYLAPDKRVVIW